MKKNLKLEKMTEISLFNSNILYLYPKVQLLLAFIF